MSEKEKRAQFGDRLRELLAAMPADFSSHFGFDVVADAIDADAAEEAAIAENLRDHLTTRGRRIEELRCERDAATGEAGAERNRTKVTRAKIEAAVERLAFEVWCTPPGMDDEGEGDHEVILRSDLTAALAGIFGPPAPVEERVESVVLPSTPCGRRSSMAETSNLVRLAREQLGFISPVREPLAHPPRPDASLRAIDDQPPARGYEDPYQIRRRAAPEEPVTVCTCGGWESGAPHAADCPASCYWSPGDGVGSPASSDVVVRKQWDPPAGHYRYFLPDGQEVSDENGSSYGEGAVYTASLLPTRGNALPPELPCEPLEKLPYAEALDLLQALKESITASDPPSEEPATVRVVRAVAEARTAARATLTLDQLRERLKVAQLAGNAAEAESIAADLRVRIEVKDAVREALRRVDRPAGCPECGYPDCFNGTHFKGIYTPGKPCPGCGKAGPDSLPREA